MKLPRNFVVSSGPQPRAAEVSHLSENDKVRCVELWLVWLVWLSHMNDMIESTLQWIKSSVGNAMENGMEILPYPQK